jgi:putative DNA primase/helicase
MTTPTTKPVSHSGHLGQAIKMANLFADDLLYVNGVGWHCWDGKRFARDDDGGARRAVHAMLKRDREIVMQLNLSTEEEEKALRAIARYETSSAISGILTEAAVLKEFSVTADEVDADPWLFNCQNGTLDLRTMVVGPHNPADRISKIASAAYHPNLSGTEWTTFLGKVLPDTDVRAYQRRLTGLSVLGEVNGDKQIAPIAYGAGANGKTTFLESVCFAMGDYAMAAEPTLLMSKRDAAHPTGVADLLGKRLVTTTETQQGARFDIALLKRLTGGETLKARWMRQDFFEFTPSHLLIMCTNHLPEIDDGSEAVWRRIRLIPFTVEIPRAERDESLGDKLRTEADAVLSWVIDGWADYRKIGPAEPAAVLAATSVYQAESDAVGRFIADECLTGGMQSSATTSVLHQAWEKWAAKNGCLPMSMIAFGRALDAKGFPADQRAHGRPRRRICLKPPNSAGFFKGAGP